MSGLVTRPLDPGTDQAGLIELFNNETGRSALESLGLGRASRVLLLSTEGATDPEFYRSVVGEPA